MTELVHRHSEGNPLFMTAIVNDLVKSGLLAEAEGSWGLTAPLEQIVPDVPETLQQMLEIQVERLSESEQRILKSASVAGRRFSAWSVAAMLGAEVAETEETCERFAERQQFLRPGRAAGVLGATQSAHYEFRHSLYREALYRRVPPAQRSRLHACWPRRPRSYSGGCRIRTSLRTGFALRAGPRVRARRALLNQRGERRAPLRASRCGCDLQHALGLLSGIAAERARDLEIEIRERISDARYAVGNLSGSAEADGIVVALAEQRGLKVAQINALTRLARVMAFSDPDACVTFCERAVKVCATHDDPLLQARTEMLAGTWHIITNGWSKLQADRCAAARQKIGELLGPEKPAYYEILYAHVQALRGKSRRLRDCAFGP